MKHITIINVAALVAILAISCSKHSTQQSPEVHKFSELPPNIATNVPIIDLGVIELAPNVPKHIKVGDADWTITEKRDASGKLKITAESPWRKITQKDIADSSLPPNIKNRAAMKEALDMTGIPTGVEIIGYFGDKLARYSLKHDAN
jgi:hypothetical protein